MRVCQQCTRYGIIQKRPERVVRRPQQSQRRMSEQTEELVVDASQLIREAIARMQIPEEQIAKRLGLKESALKAYARGTRKPPIADARVLERFLRIRLVETTREESAGFSSRDSGTLSIGDTVRIRKR